LVQRLEHIERRSGIEPVAYDVQSLITVGELAEQFREALVTALASR
jgi:hypothetical protein